MEQLPLIREEENNKFVNDLMTWKSDRDLLEEIEKELNENYKVLRAEHFRNIEVETKAHHMAVETLGFWDLAKVGLQYSISFVWLFAILLSFVNQILSYFLNNLFLK